MQGASQKVIDGLGRAAANSGLSAESAVEPVSSWVLAGIRGAERSKHFNIEAEAAEQERIVDPDSAVGQQFQERILKIAVRLYPDRDFSSGPLRFVFCWMIQISMAASAWRGRSHL